MTELAKLAAVELPLRREVDGLPGDVLTEAAAHLRRPFAPAAVKWKVQSTWGSGGLVIPYIDARLVTERLNAVVPGLWDDDYVAWGQKALMCLLTVDGITRRDVGTAARTEPEKSIVSDALKRAAVKFGVAVSIYSMKQVTLDVGPGPNQLNKRTRKTREGDKEIIELRPQTVEWLSDRYAAWLRARGERMFGPALDHGDEAGAFGADDELEGGPTEEPGEVSLPALDSPEATQLIEEVRDAYALLRQMDPMMLLPAHFEARLRRAHHSFEDLAALRSEIEQLANAAADKAAAGEES